MTGRARLTSAFVAAVAGLVAGAVVPEVVAAHQLTERYASPLPLAAYLLGAAVAVGLSFAFVVARSGPPHMADRVRHPRTIVVPGAVRAALRIVGLIGWAWVVVQCVVAGPGDAADASSLILWVYGWVGLSLVAALVGPAWRWLDPFATLHDIGAAVGRRLGLHGPPILPYPAALATWPAVGGYAAFVWLELVVEGARGGRPLGALLLLYSGWTLAMMAQYGRDAWRAHGETFSVWFAILGRLAPLAFEAVPSGRDAALSPPDDTRLIVRSLGGGIARASWTADAVVLVAIATGAILYDGLSQTQIFLDTFGAPGVGGDTAILLGWLAIVIGLALLVGRYVGLPALGAGLLPIAVGYLIAHYLTFLLFDGQRIVALLNDPLDQGASLLGIADFQTNQAWLPAAAAWAMQLGAVVGGHILGARAGHSAAIAAVTAEAPHDAGIRLRRVRARQVPLALLMVGLTTLTLWSLGQVIVEHPEAASAPRSAGASASGIAPVPGS